MVKRAEKAVSLGQRAKARAQRAARAARELEQGVAIRAGGKKAQGVKRLPETSTRNLGKGFGLEQTGKGTGSRMATRGQRAAVARSGRKRIAAGAGGVGAMSLFGGDKEKKKDTPAEKPTTAAKKKYNVGVSKGGVPFKESFRHHRNKGAKTFTWNGKKYTTELDTEKAKRTAAAKKPAAKKKVGPIRKFLLGDDGKFGGARGAIDFLPGKSRPKRKEKVAGSPASGANRRPKPAGKAMGGMMKSKMASKGGARGGKRVPPGMMGGGMMKSKMASKGGARGGKKMMMPGGMKNGGMAKKGYALGGPATKNKKKSSFPDLTGDGRVTQADILKGRGVTKKKNGGMMKSKMASKGGAKGGRMPGGMKNGGMAKKGYSKGGAVRGKPRGVGAALRGYGKALK